MLKYDYYDYDDLPTYLLLYYLILFTKSYRYSSELTANNRSQIEYLENQIEQHEQEKNDIVAQIQVCVSVCFCVCFCACLFVSVVCLYVHFCVSVCIYLFLFFISLSVVENQRIVWL